MNAWGQAYTNVVRVVAHQTNGPWIGAHVGAAAASGMATYDEAAWGALQQGDTLVRARRQGEPVTWSTNDEGGQGSGSIAGAVPDSVSPSAVATANEPMMLEDDEGEGGRGEGTARSEETGVHMAEARGNAAQQATADADGSERTDGQTAEGAGGETTSQGDRRAAVDTRAPECRTDEATGPATPVRARVEASRASGTYYKFYNRY